MPAAPEPATDLGRPTRRKGEATAERILDAAEELFATHGFAGTTLRDVAAQVGIRNPSLYNHFESKAALYTAVLERGIGPILEALAQYLATGPGVQHEPSDVMERMLGLLARRPQIPRLVLHETLGGGHHLTPLLREWIERAFASAYQMMERAPGAHRFSREQMPHLVLAMYHVMLGYFTMAPLHRAISGEDLLSEAALARQAQLLRQMADALFGTPEAPAPE